MLSRDWRCANGHEFHSYEKANPDCPVCGNCRVEWVPGGGHIGKVSPGADATLKSLAASYGLTNLNSPSPSRLNRAMPAAKAPPSAGSMGTKQWALGFASEVFTSPHCAPSTAPIDIKGFKVVGQPMMKGGDMSYKGVTPSARHRPRSGQ